MCEKTNEGMAKRAQHPEKSGKGLCGESRYAL